MSNSETATSAVFLRDEYSHFATSLLENEALGERRVNLFLTISGVILAALGLKEGVLNMSTSDAGWRPSELTFAGLTIVFLLGWLTMIRLVNRNLVTDQYIRGLSRVRRYFLERDAGLFDYLLYPPPEEERWRTKEWGDLFSFGKGGLVENVAVINSLAMGAIGSFLILNTQSHWFWIVIAGLIIGSLTWVFQFCYVKYRYDTAKYDNKNGAAPPNSFRANVGVMLINDRGEVLALERCDHRNSWQMPQGGIDANETPREAALRELGEETNVSKDKIEYVDEYPDWLTYELDAPTWKHGRGQTQKWFVYRFTGSEASIVPRKPEFCAKEWMRLDRLIEETAKFRRGVYEKLAAHFSRLLAVEAGEAQR